MEHKEETSWQKVSKWYDDTVGELGHHYHQTVIIPNLLRLLKFKEAEKPRLLDLACGQGVLSRHLPTFVQYEGVDIAPDFIRFARQYNKNPLHHFHIGDVTKPLPVEGRFSHCTVLLALQNIREANRVLANAARLLNENGSFILVLNHPCYRIPRQSSWEIDQSQKLQFRRVNRYMTPLEIPIKTHPGKGGASPESLSFHHPLSHYFGWLQEAGFVVENLEEWCSKKTSVGKAAKMENRCREEFPLFMAILARRR